MRKLTVNQLRYYLGFVVLIVFWLFLLGCQKEEIKESIIISGAFASNSMYFGDTNYLEIDIDGETYSLPVHYVSHGIVSSESIDVVQGWKQVDRIEFFNSKGSKISYVKSIDSIGTINGLVVMGVPFKFKGDKISCQIFNVNY